MSKKIIRKPRKFVCEYDDKGNRHLSPALEVLLGFRCYNFTYKECCRAAGVVESTWQNFRKENKELVQELEQEFREMKAIRRFEVLEKHADEFPVINMALINRMMTSNEDN